MRALALKVQSLYRGWVVRINVEVTMAFNATAGCMAHRNTHARCCSLYTLAQSSLSNVRCGPIGHIAVSVFLALCLVSCDCSPANFTTRMFATFVCCVLCVPRSATSPRLWCSRAGACTRVRRTFACTAAPRRSYRPPGVAARTEVPPRSFG